jgi:hypothetical protein
MKISMRVGLFETNSSNTNRLVIKQVDDELECIRDFDMDNPHTGTIVLDEYADDEKICRLIVKILAFYDLNLLDVKNSKYFGYDDEDLL